MSMDNSDLVREYDLANQLTVQFSLKFGYGDEKDFLLVRFGPPGITDEQIDEVFEIEAFELALANFEGERMRLLKTQYPERYKALVQ